MSKIPEISQTLSKTDAGTHQIFFFFQWETILVNICNKGLNCSKYQ